MPLVLPDRPRLVQINYRDNRSAIFGISGRLTQTFTTAAQANRTRRWLAALPPKKLN
ncbi:MAG: hypothetical protein MPL62_08345 [Alphaproteobacteria bacterium]|nr:hypothetical protein [Alphaproteobacteria bacterium]